MQAHPTTPGDIVANRQGYVVEPKIDGWRCIAMRLQNGDVVLRSRTGKSMTSKLPHIVAELESLPAKLGKFVLDGELGYTTADGSQPWKAPIIDYNLTARTLGSDVETSLAKQNVNRANDKEVKFFVFDLLELQGTSLIFRPDRERRALLIRHIFVDKVMPHVHLLPRYPMWIEEFYEGYVLRGGEGVMLKNPEADYVPGKRLANRWYKLKKFDTMDVVIDDEYLIGQGKYHGMVGAIHFGVFGHRPDGTRIFVPLGKCSGMTDWLREDMTENWEDYRGKVMEIRYFGKVGADGGGLRHPQFLRMRPDKAPSECTVESVGM